MPKEFSRTQRVAELIQRQLSLIILREIDDPRAKMITISHVEVSRDLSFAKVYITPMGNDDPKVIAQTLKVLKKASAYIRHLLAGAVKLRIVPQLQFVYDGSISEGVRLSRLIDEAIDSDQKIHDANNKD